MGKRIHQLDTDLQRVLSSSVQRLNIEHDEITLTVKEEDLAEVMSRLRDDPEFAFEQLVDLSGVDYLEYGVGEWSTHAATSEGFSRGAEKASFGRFTFDDPPHSRTLETPRFAVVYHLLSVACNHRLRVRAFCEDDNLPMVPSVHHLWASADWYEREAFDLYGIIFDGHPDLRRILTDYGFTGHPFRKDFPLVGHVEVRYDPEQKRVVYQPVSIEPRITVPKVIRDDHRFESGEVKENDA